jgi:hypothetical protein
MLPAREIKILLPRKSRRHQIYGYALDREWLRDYAKANDISGLEGNLPLKAVTHISNELDFERKL